MKTLACTLVLFAGFSGVASAQVCIDGQCVVVAQSSTSTAQGVAEICARRGRLQHMGGNPYQYEGLGMASTREGAYRACCYANSGMKTMDVGYAQDSRGRWYCCRRYSR